MGHHRPASRRSTGPGADGDLDTLFGALVLHALVDH